MCVVWCVFVSCLITVLCVWPPLASWRSWLPSIARVVNVFIQLVAFVGVPDDHPRLVGVFVPAWLFPDRVVWCAVVVVFNEFTPTRLTRSPRIIINVGQPGFTVVGHNVTLEIHVLVTLDWLPWFALPTIRDHITASSFHNLGNLRVKRGLRLPSP